MSEFIQIHALTVYPPGNLNRDDLGRPKTAIFGGVQRLRISSQSLKRAWRTSEIFSGALAGSVGTRTKDIGNNAYEKLIARGVASDRADEQSKRIAGVFGKLKGGKEGEGKKTAKAPKDGKPDKEVAKRAVDGRQIEQLAHIGAAELAALDRLLDRIASGETPSDQECAALLLNAHGSADIALFGRMLAATPQRNVDAAVQVAHAITVHKVTVEDDYFTAVDDLNDGSEDAGAGHIGTTEFGSGVFYHYICINRSLLDENLEGNGDLGRLARRALAEACAKIAPSGKQNSFATRARAVYMLAERGEEQPRNLAMAFLEPVTGDDLLGAAIRSLEGTRDRMDKVYGPCARERYSFNVPAGDGSLQELLDFVAK